jgi:hypothetical protein
MVNDKEVLLNLRRSRESAMAARRQRQEEDERLRKEAHDSRVAKEYAQNMTEWSRMVHAYTENMQKIMEVTFHMHPFLSILLSLELPVNEYAYTFDY